MCARNRVVARETLMPIDLYGEDSDGSGFSYDGSDPGKEYVKARTTIRIQASGRKMGGLSPPCALQVV